MDQEARIAELEAGLLRVVAKTSAQVFVFNAVLTMMLKDHPDVGRELAAMARKEVKLGKIPEPFASKPEFEPIFAAHVRVAIELLIDPHPSS